MCCVSNMGDMYRDKFSDPRWTPKPIWDDSVQPFTPFTPLNPILKDPSQVTREEFDLLKKAVEEMRDVLMAAKKYDEATGQPDCEMDDKVALLKKVAEMVGVDLSSVFGPK